MINKIILIGNGKLARAVRENFSTYSSLPVVDYISGIEPGNTSLFLHIGSGREYAESLECALKNDCPFIQAATEKSISLYPPEPGVISYISAPNLDINIIKLMFLLRDVGSLFKEEEITLIESHQAEKTSQAGTAIHFAHSLNIPETEIVSIRDQERQKEMGIKNIQQHAFHRITIGDSHSCITLETRVEGAESYVKGLSQIISCIPELAKRNYKIDDLIEMKLL